MFKKIKMYSGRVLNYAKGHKKISLVILVVFVAAFYFLVIKRTSAQPKYQTAQVSRGTLISTVSESGNVTGNQTPITSPTNGVITQVYVVNGAKVNKNDPLFHVESTASEDQKRTTYTSYLAAKSALDADTAQLYALQSTMFANWNTYYNLAISSLYQNGDGSPNTNTRITPQFTTVQDNWLNSEANYKNQQGVLAKDQAGLSASYLAYQETQSVTVNAPIEGTIANLAVTTGSNVSAAQTNSNSSTSSSSTGTEILDIGNFDNLQVKVQIAEVDVPNVHEGEKATITLDAFPGKTFVGTVTGVDTIGVNSSGVVTYNAYIKFISPPPEIRPAMTASVNIQTQRKDNVLKVSTSVIQTASGTSTVRVLQNGRVNSVSVETGMASDTETEIISGLSEGETVVIGTIASGTGSSGTSPFSSFGGRGFGGGGVIRGGGGR